MISSEAPVFISQLRSRYDLFRYADCDSRLRNVILISSMIGMLIGSFIGLYTDSFEVLLAGAQFDFTLSEDAAYIDLLWRSFRYVVFAVLLSTSILGVAIVPFLAALRTFSLGCFSAAVLKEQTLHAYLIAVARFAIPSMLSLPAFFIICTDGIEFSLRLWKRLPLVQPSQPRLRRFAIVFLLCLAEAAYTCCLLPHILLLIS